MNTSRRHLPLATLAVVVTATVLAGCAGPGGTSSGDAEDAKISVLTFETPALTPQFWDDSIARAQEAVPGLSVQKLVASGDRATYAKQLAATGQFPDVTTSFPPEMFSQMMSFDKEWLKENYIYPEAGSLDGETKSVPAGAQVIPYVYYNKSLFEEVGADVPKTWSDFEALIPTFKEAGITPVEAVGADAWAAGYLLTGLLSVDILGNDADWVQKRYEGDVKFTDDDIVSVVEKYRDLIEAGAFGPAILSTDFPTANKDFLDGKAAMYVMGSWFSGSGYVNADQAENVGVFPLPSESGEVILPFLAAGSLMVDSESKHAEQAMEFAKAWQTDPENYKVLIESDGLFPLLKNYTFKDYGATTTPLYDDSYALVTDESSNVVSAFGSTSNDDRLPAGINDKFATLAQALLSDPNTDIRAQLAEIDAAWDAAPKS